MYVCMYDNRTVRFQLHPYRASPDGPAPDEHVRLVSLALGCDLCSVSWQIFIANPSSSRSCHMIRYYVSHRMPWSPLLLHVVRLLTIPQPPPRTHELARSSNFWRPGFICFCLRIYYCYEVLTNASERSPFYIRINKQKISIRYIGTLCTTRIHNTSMYTAVSNPKVARDLWEIMNTAVYTTTRWCWKASSSDGKRKKCCCCYIRLVTKVDTYIYKYTVRTYNMYEHRCCEWGYGPLSTTYHYSFQQRDAIFSWLVHPSCLQNTYTSSLFFCLFFTRKQYTPY